MRPDILVRDSTGEAVLAVEVKARRGVDEAWAAELRRNLRAHGPVFNARYFMILAMDETYLWIESRHDSAEIASPDAIARTADLMGSHLSHGTTDGRALELLASSWLSAVAGARSLEDLRESSRDFLVRTGLYDALRGQTVGFEVA